MAIGGYQAEFSIYLTGLNSYEKFKSFELMSRKMVDSSKMQVFEFQLYGSPKEDPKSQLEATLQLRIFAQATDQATLSPGNFLGPMMSNQLQGFPGLTANFDFRTASPKVYCTYFPGLVKQSVSQQRVHFLKPPAATSWLRAVPGLSRSDEGILDVPGLTIMTAIKDLPKQKDIDPSNPVPLETFGETTKIALGSLVYARSGDKGANVNVGFFFPAGTNSTRKWDWLRSFLTTDKFRSKKIWPFMRIKHVFWHRC